MADAIGGWWTMHGAAIRVSVTLQAKLMSMHCGRKLTSPTMSPLQAKSPKPSNLNIPPLKNTKHVHSTPAVQVVGATRQHLTLLLIPAPSKQTPSIELGGINTLTHPPLILNNKLSLPLPHSAALHPAGS